MQPLTIEDALRIIAAEDSGLMELLVRGRFMDARYKGRLKVLIAHFQFGDHSSISKVAKAAGMDRATVYYHLQQMRLIHNYQNKNMSWNPKSEPTLPRNLRESKSRAFALAVKAELKNGVIPHGRISEIAKEHGLNPGSITRVLSVHGVEYSVMGRRGKRRKPVKAKKTQKTARNIHTPRAQSRKKAFVEAVREEAAKGVLPRGRILEIAQDHKVNSIACAKVLKEAGVEYEVEPHEPTNTIWPEVPHVLRKGTLDEQIEAALQSFPV